MNFSHSHRVVIFWFRPFNCFTLQQSALKFWSKDIKNIQGTQNVFNHRAQMNTLAAQGKWSIELENK